VPRKLDYRAVPWVIFTEPEAARVGLTEEEARQQHGAAKVHRITFEHEDRAVTDSEATGLVKVIATPPTSTGAKEPAKPSSAGSNASSVIREPSRTANPPRIRAPTLRLRSGQAAREGAAFSPGPHQSEPRVLSEVEGSRL